MRSVVLLVLAACGSPVRATTTNTSVDDRPPCPDIVIIRDSVVRLPWIDAFVKDSDEPTDAHVLDEIARLMQAYPTMEAGVVGHASDDEKDPDALSEARARRMRDELVRRGVAATRLDVHGVGTKRPLDVRDQRKNRYVSTLIIASYGKKILTWNGTDFENVPWVPDPNAKPERPCRRKDGGAP
jgi:outer membrane protein OmpA-like peptidoglycan-associated protein